MIIIILDALVIIWFLRSLVIAANGLRVAPVDDFGALRFQLVQKFDSSTQLQFCTSPPIEATRC